MLPRSGLSPVDHNRCLGRLAIFLFLGFAIPRACARSAALAGAAALRIADSLLAVIRLGYRAGSKERRNDQCRKISHDALLKVLFNLYKKPRRA